MKYNNMRKKEDSIENKINMFHEKNNFFSMT